MEKYYIMLSFMYEMIFMWLIPLAVLFISVLALQFVLYRFFNINLYKIITKKLF